MVQNLEKNLGNVYLSPQSVSSRIKSINEEIKNNINRNREEMKCNKVKDEEEDEEVRSIKSQGSISVDNRISIGNRIKIDLLENKSEMVKGDQSKVRDLVKNYSMRLNEKECYVTGEGSIKEGYKGNGYKGEGSIIEGYVKGEGYVTGEGYVNNPFTQRHNNPIKKTPFIAKGNPFTNKETPFTNNPLIKKDSPFNKNLYSTSNNNNPLSNNPLSVLSLNEHSFPIRPFPSLSLSPINVIYAPKNPPTLEKKVDLPSPKKSFNKTLTSSFSFYGPGIEITEDITFSILNTIYKFENGIEDTIYYFKIKSKNNDNPISWIIKKSLNQIRDFLRNSSFKKDLDLSFNPYDKKIRDNVIITILNTLGENHNGNNNGNGDINGDNGDINKGYNDSNNKDSNHNNGDFNNNNDIKNKIILQFFILTNITKDLDKRSNYLLMSNPSSPILEPFNFRLVGQALVCYDKTNRVKKIFLLKGCKVEIHSEYSFKISSLENNVILYSSCTVERDNWIRDIEEFIK